MAVDSPARIVVIGGGPIGLEAALYGRFLGYDVTVFEANELAHRLESPPSYSECSSPLGWAAIGAQADAKMPAASLIPTSEEWMKNYGYPLATSDLLDGRIETKCVVKQVTWVEETDLAPSTESEVESSNASTEESEFKGQFQLEYERHGETCHVVSDVVIDASGRLGPTFKLNGITIKRDANEVPIGEPAWPADSQSLDTQIVMPTPGFFIVGRKRYGERDDFSLRSGRQHVQLLFSHLGDRESLDLYSQFQAQQS